VIDRQQDITAGLLIGAAVALKPQVGLPFLFFYFLQRRQRVVGIAFLVVLVLAATAILYLFVNHAQWLESYGYDNRELFAYGSLGDFTQGNPIRFGLINLQVLLYTFVGDRTTANLVALGGSAAMGICWLRLLRRKNGSENELLGLSTLVVLSLLPVYHRVYDASLLMFPLAWSVTEFSGPFRRWARRALLLISVFLLPGGSALEQLQHTSRLQAVQHSWWWTCFIMPHQIWALIFLSVTLLQAMRERTIRVVP
jgi:hypothetical protein